MEKLDFETKGNTEEILLEIFPKENSQYQTKIWYKIFENEATNHGHVFVETTDEAIKDRIVKDFNFEVTIGRDHLENGENLIKWTPPPKEGYFEDNFVLDCTTNCNNYNKPNLAEIHKAVFESQFLKKQGDGAVILEVWNAQGKYNIEIMEKVHMSKEMTLEVNGLRHRLV